ncbi:unnamed protein product [Meganyctiphanes norvegica]|uniref:Methyltransferase FkbM domain-containing protein n=1 Tax=Meganyctiphanes norvegica TaxID=48144 RepID=A0AAV2RFC4_MEGNR
MVGNYRKSTAVALYFVLLMMLMCVTMNKYPYNEHQHQKEILHRLDGPLTPDDPKLVEYVRQRFLNPPSTEQYNLVEEYPGSEYHPGGSYKCCSWTFYNRALKDLYKNFPPGFFIEAGALDGEYLSNTLYLERELGWTGLLVEADSDMFKRLVKKNRKAWASNSCLATTPYPIQDTLVKYNKPLTDEEKKASIHARDVRPHGLGTLSGSKDMAARTSRGFPVFEPVQCLPFHTLLLALNREKVDLVSLDVEDAEMEILRLFPWDQVQVDVWLIEHRPKNDHFDQMTSGDPQFVKWFESLGYRLYDFHIDYADYIFVHNGSDIYHIAFATHNQG